MENIKAFFGFSNSDDLAKHRCREYLIEAVKYGKTLEPIPPFIAQVEEYLAVSGTPSSSTAESSPPASGSTDIDSDANSSVTAAVLSEVDPFWIKWDEYKEDALNLLTTKPENEGIKPEGNFVNMWQHLEHGRLPHSTAPPEVHNRRRSSMARVRLA